VGSTSILDIQVRWKNQQRCRPATTAPPASVRARVRPARRVQSYCSFRNRGSTTRQRD
jgi:hypothetical protein